MPVIVQKYGGTSVADAGHIQAVADRVVRYREQGYDVLVVVSAMGDTTDELLSMAHEISRVPEPRELDMLLTAGERISMSLLAIAINARGCKAASYTGSQAGIITDTQHGAAKIVEIRPKRIKESLDAGNAARREQHAAWTARLGALAAEKTESLERIDGLRRELSVLENEAAALEDFLLTSLRLWTKR